MAVFKYKAISKDGARVHGVVEAYDEFEAVGQIKETCSIVTSIREVSALPKGDIVLFPPKQIKDKSLALLCSQFAIILRAGLPIVRAVSLIQEQISDKQLKTLLGKVADDVASGYGLAQSFENKGGKELPTTFIETVKAGEDSGTLEISFKKLQAYYESAAQIKGKVKSAMRYPAFLMALAVVVIAIIMIVTMPTFTSMFADLGIELPALTKGIMAVSNFFASYWWLVLILGLMLGIGIKLYSGTEKGAMLFATLALKLPAIGPMNRMKGASQFSNTLSTLLTAGIPLVRAVAVTGRVLDNRYLGRRLSLLSPQLEEGRSLGDLMRGETSAFPEMLCEMTAMGEATGALEETLDTIGIYYDAETQTASDKALGMLQPAITVFMGIIIGLIVIGLYLPMFTMYSGM